MANEVLEKRLVISCQRNANPNPDKNPAAHLLTWPSSNGSAGEGGEKLHPHALFVEMLNNGVALENSLAVP